MLYFKYININIFVEVIFKWKFDKIVNYALKLQYSLIDVVCVQVSILNWLYGVNGAV